MTEAFSSIDHLHMPHALRLAERGLYTTQPNPRVGCVIAHGERVVGAGFHARAGQPHAEVFALREAGEAARGATAYVTLEPCAHFGRTPPCADALVAAGVARVVIAAEDPFPQVAGNGIAKLRAAGIVVETGLLREPARELNIGFFSRIESGRPWVRVKLAMSLDGRTALANGESKWITGEAARADVQRWRARSSAILTGSGTVLADNPRLTVRPLEDGDSSLLPGPAGEEGEAFPPAKPLRAILDRQLRTPATSHVLDSDAPTLLMHAANASVPAHLRAVDRVALPEPSGHLDLHAALAELARRQINELHVEAGPTLCGALLSAGLADELLLYIAPVLLGDMARPLLALPPLACMADRWRLRTLDRRMVGEDIRLRLRPEL
ncbi:bifunctional diaminohydroxyphosphoribosylaminopyrimidine deaminase/5-amino-6-(5-phosphoribosylamino)uracil reductase RibD [Frateuria sp. STR12]|uniref:bifunctional diaminohydroxyphosphoribosylaminopyrimidine deaminase/5-amino-6-(5-phosphoribosylamino)uracil reductase RibD n=1 Tax=Frateuria hangzhouensis TaxID=2995589 RepID=UPI00226101A3|nr:bifunctional diaminohydroxyphosphoribosylaminopyrimidine deaminase/5-amino-6-(5-phosphoribosylamino)uracil reductase RibD [Frateuria sp. STR12]MCX7513694.1 bifunctional diaminohydroxyphosphoribosylaminopyrimidine deaminase/5-amino-6-(5-phosphoribosylamino)uracil reductase RibD [Frateuria sp. STR12]